MSAYSPPLTFHPRLGMRPWWRDAISAVLELLGGWAVSGIG